MLWFLLCFTVATITGLVTWYEKKISDLELELNQLEADLAESDLAVTLAGKTVTELDASLDRCRNTIVNQQQQIITLLGDVDDTTAKLEKVRSMALPDLLSPMHDWGIVNS